MKHNSRFLHEWGRYLKSYFSELILFFLLLLPINAFRQYLLKRFWIFPGKKNYSYFVNTLGAFSQNIDALPNNSIIKWVLEFLLTLQGTQLRTELSFLLSFLLLLMTKKLWPSKHHQTHFLLQNNTYFTQNMPHKLFSVSGPGMWLGFLNPL